MEESGTAYQRRRSERRLLDQNGGLNHSLGKKAPVTSPRQEGTEQEAGAPHGHSQRILETHQLIQHSCKDTRHKLTAKTETKHHVLEAPLL